MADSVDLEQSQERASQALLKRFESDVGYREFPDTLNCCRYLIHRHTIVATLLHPRAPAMQLERRDR